MDPQAIARTKKLWEKKIGRKLNDDEATRMIETVTQLFEALDLEARRIDGEEEVRS